MSLSETLLRSDVTRDMSEGIILVSFGGRIIYLNPSAERILGISAEETLGRVFFETVLHEKDNDDFFQIFLDAIYDKKSSHSGIVPFRAKDSLRQLRVVTSFLYEDGKPEGVIVALDDITELMELRVEHERQMKVLLDSLVGALSTAIEERSRYNANHTRSMVRYAERFLDYLDETESEWRFGESRRRAFLMSVWLHDVGKLAVPPSVMDKSTRLGDGLLDVRHRFTEIGLLDRIALLEGKIDGAEFERRGREREDALALIERVNGAPFLTDDELSAVEELAGRTYTDESGETRPWLSEEERNDLRIRRGTLTDEERAVMQSHVVVTERILSRVQFPDLYAQVPAWASAHHELLNGTGYPRGVTAEEIPREVRLLTILDVFDALTAKDRPYKEPMPAEKALSILRAMARDGAVDGEVLDLFEASRAWVE